jgi:hypothetical protein
MLLEAEAVEALAMAAEVAGEQAPQQAALEVLGL